MCASRFLPLFCVLVIQSAFGGPMGTGSITGAFENTSPHCIAPPDSDNPFVDGAQCIFTSTIDPNDTITWGDSVGSLSGPNKFQFSGNSFNVEKSVQFVVGTLFYHNGSIFVGTEINTVDLVLTSHPDPLVDPTIFGGLLPLNITIVQTVNDGISKEADADFMYFTDHPEFGSFRVYEDAATSVEVLAEFDSLAPLGFGTVSDPTAGFLSPSIDPFVPEPSTWALLAVSLAGLVLARSRRKGQYKMATNTAPAFPLRHDPPPIKGPGSITHSPLGEISPPVVCWLP